MSKSKRGKSASGNEISKWETELIQAPFNEETWRSCVVFIAPNKFDDNVYVDMLSDVVVTGLRKLFSVITEENLIKDIREFSKGQTGGGKGKGSHSRPPPFFEVCEQAKGILDQGETISPALMAKVLKFKLLQIKQKDQERREEERKAAKAAEAAKKDDTGKKSRSPSGKRSKSPGKKKGKKGEAETVPSPKKDTKLKKRGEVEDTFKTIDDEPDEEGCPKHYVLIHGILMPAVIPYMTDIGVNVDAIICIKSESYDKLEIIKETDTLEEQPEEKEEDPEELERAIQDQERQAQKQEFERKLEMFWKDSENIVLKAPLGHKLKDMAKYDVVVRDKDVPEESLQEIADERKTEFGTVLFEDVAVTCYDMLDHVLQYNHYLDNMKLLHVPVHTTASPPPVGLAPSVTEVPSSQSVTGTQAPDLQAPIHVDVDTRYYKHLMDTVPPESHSVPLILNCLLEQVTATVDESNPLDKDTPPRSDGLNHLLAAHINCKANKLALSNDDKKSVSENAEEEKKTVHSNVPILLHHNDALTSRAHHLQSQNGLNPMSTELKMLEFFAQGSLGDFPEPKGRETVERAASANELRHFLRSRSVDPGILDQAFKQYAFEGMLLKTVNDDGDIIDPIELDDAFKSYCNPWDYPYNKLEDFMKVKFCSDDSGQLKISEVETNSPLTSFRNLDDWCFVEHFDKTTLLQVLEEARFSLPYIDTYYHKRDHALLVALHNPMGQNSKSRSSWQTKLHSNVGFRNYLDNVAPSLHSWIAEQERIKKEAERTPTPPPVVIEEPTPPVKERSRFGMMTRAEINAQKAEEEEKNKKGKGKKSARGSRSPGRSAKSRAKDQSPEKKDKKREGSTTSRPKSGSSSAKGSRSVKSAASKKGKSKSRTSSCEGDETPQEQPTEPLVEQHFDFIGYDVGDNLIHASGSLSTLFPSDGGQIRVDKHLHVQKSKNVRVSIYKDGNIFILHLVEPVDEIIPEEELEPVQTKQNEEQDDEENDPLEEGIEKSETEGTEKEAMKEDPKAPKSFCDFSSFVAQFNDGMILTHSGYGPSGSLIDKEPQKTEVPLVTGIAVPDVGATAQGTPSPQPKAGSPKARKKIEEEAKRMEELIQQQEEEKQRLEEEAKKRAEEEKKKKPFQHVYITCPDGLHVEYFNDGSYASADDKGGVGVRQLYPVKGLGRQECEKVRQKPAMGEISRTILTDGTVIKFQRDNAVQVLFPDGATSKCQHFSRTPPPNTTTNIPTNKPPDPSPAKKTLRSTSSQKSSEEPTISSVALPEKVAQWVSTGIGGARVRTKDDGTVESIDGVLYSEATCPESGQVLRTREDNVVTIDRPDGSLIVEHEDGTKITTFYHQIQRQVQAPDNETGKEAQYDTFNGKFVKVECPGFATVLFNCEEGSCCTVFGNGVNIETCADGVATMDRLDGSQLHIDSRGVVSFAPRQLAGKIDLAAGEPAVEPDDVPAGIYVMRSTKQLCCEMTDEHGNHFSVMSNGVCSIDKDSTQQTQDQPTGPAGPLTVLVPRYFIIQADGSGFELLRHSDVSQYLSLAEKDPGTAVMRSPVEGLHQATGVTVLRPYSGGISSIWFAKKDEDILIPEALRERDFKAFPAREEKRPGPKFGTNVASGLNNGNVTKKITAAPTISCPRALELRQLIQYKPLTDEQRQIIVKSLKEYGEYVAKRQEKLDSILPQDPREESEKLRAEELESKMTEKAEGEDPKHDAIENTEIQELTQEDQQTNSMQEALDSLSSELQGDAVSQKYVDSITPAPVPAPPPPRWKRPQAEWERDKIELAELNYGKNALRNKEVPPYFETSEGQNFLRQEYSNDAIDMDALTSRLAEQTRHPPPGEGSVPDTPRSNSGELQKSLQEFSSPEVAQRTGSNSVSNDVGSPAANGTTLSPNNLRPTNPTPAHAKGDGTPTPLRPNNPTPAQASSKPVNVRPSNPTPKQAANQGSGVVASSDSPNLDESTPWRKSLESVQEVMQSEENDFGENTDDIADTPGNPKTGPKSLYVGVTGEPRKDGVKLPASILSSKPGALTNTQFLETEDPVRRRVNTVSVAGGNNIAPGRVDGLRGFELLPPKVSFGVLREGCTYVHTVLMKNVGIDSCRFKVKQPPPSTGLLVVYNPGPVAAGMNTKLDVEIFAVAVGVVGETGVGQVGHHVEIVTETDVLYLPVYATIMTSHEYENRYGNQESALTSGTVRIPNRLPSRDIMRPRKAVDYALIESKET